MCNEQRTNQLTMCSASNSLWCTSVRLQRDEYSLFVEAGVKVQLNKQCLAIPMNMLAVFCNTPCRIRCFMQVVRSNYIRGHALVVIYYSRLQLALAFNISMHAAFINCYKHPQKQL